MSIVLSFILWATEYSSHVSDKGKRLHHPRLININELTYKEAAVKMTLDRIGKDAVFVYKRCPVVLLKTAIFHLARMVVSVWVVFLIGINDEHPLIKHTGSIISFQNVTSLMDWLILHWPADTHTDQSYGMQFLELRERYKEPRIGQSVQSFRLSPYHTQVRQGFFCKEMWTQRKWINIGWSLVCCCCGLKAVVPPCLPLSAAAFSAPQ